MSAEVPKSDSEYIRYRGVRSMNRDVFLLSHPDFVHANDKLHDGLGALAQGLRGKRDAFGRSKVSFIPFLWLMQRQIFSAFDHLASYQAYQAWMMIRPAIEIPLIMGKWVDNPATAEIWNRRALDPRAYQHEYSGSRMQSASLLRSAEIQSVLKTLNEFVHPNPFYYHRHLQLADAGNEMVTIAVEYFDSPDTMESHVLAFLHLVALVHDSVREMLETLLGAIADTSEFTGLIESEFKQRARNLFVHDIQSRRVLIELGRWPENLK